MIGFFLATVLFQAPDDHLVISNWGFERGVLVAGSQEFAADGVIISFRRSDEISRTLIHIRKLVGPGESEQGFYRPLMTKAGDVVDIAVESFIRFRVVLDVAQEEIGRCRGGCPRTHVGQGTGVFFVPIMPAEFNAVQILPSLCRQELIAKGHAYDVEQVRILRGHPMA